MTAPATSCTLTSGGSLLVLDDDRSVGQILVALAQASGFEARLCDNLDALLQALRDWAPSYLAIDLTLPGTTGQDVLHSIAQSDCTARVLICSGAGPDELASALQQAQALGLRTAGVLAKPYRLAALRALLNAAG